MKTPISSDVARVKAKSSQNVSFKSYEIPEGVFRGVLWPSKDNANFQIWLIDRNNEHFYYISAPPGFSRYEIETTEDWNFEILNTTNAKQVYVANKKDNSKTIQIELPIKKRPYSFNALKNSKGEEIVVFMDISETVRDTGLFGYVVITNNE